MNDRDDRADGEVKFVTERHINQNAEQRQQRGDDGRAFDFFTHHRADALLFDGFELRLWEFFRERLYDFIGGAN